MLKKICSLLLILCMFMTLFVFAEEDIKVVLDDVQLSFDQSPIIVGSRTLVPLRTIFEAIGAKVTWYPETTTAFAELGLKTVSISIGSLTLFKNSEVINLDVPAQLVNGRTLVPIRAIAEAFDLDVTWNQKTRTVIIKHTQDHIIHYKTIKNNVLDNDGSLLIEASVSYPEIKNTTNAVAIAKINDKYKAQAEEYLQFIPQSMKESALSDKIFSSEVGLPFVPYSLNKTYGVSYDKNNLLSVVTTDYSNTGGIYPNIYKYGEIINLKTGEPMLLTDILNGNADEIHQMVIDNFTSQVNEDPTKFYQDAIETLQSDTIDFSYYLDSDSIIFLLQPYDIAPHAAGYPSVKILFSDKDKFLKEL